MSSISQITLPNGSTYDLKDATARANIPVASDDVPLMANFADPGVDNKYSRSDHVHKSEVFEVTCDIDLANMSVSNFSHTFNEVLQERNDGRKILLHAKAMLGENEGGTLFAWLVDKFGLIEDDELTVYQLWFSGFLYAEVLSQDDRDHIYYATVGMYADGNSYFILAELLDSNDRNDIEDALDDKEDVSNKVTSLSAYSTDGEYPSAKCVYDLVGDVESILHNINNGSGS